MSITPKKRAELKRYQSKMEKIHKNTLNVYNEMLVEVEDVSKGRFDASNLIKAIWKVVCEEQGRERFWAPSIPKHQIEQMAYNAEMLAVTCVVKTQEHTAGMRHCMMRSFMQVLNAIILVDDRDRTVKLEIILAPRIEYFYNQWKETVNTSNTLHMKILQGVKETHNLRMEEIRVREGEKTSDHFMECFTSKGFDVRDRKMKMIQEQTAEEGNVDHRKEVEVIRVREAEKASDHFKECFTSKGVDVRVRVRDHKMKVIQEQTAE
jgi:hypothetical protein